MTRHFRCTACGKCCYGQLPLTWRDAEANAHLFPLGMVWTPVAQASKDFKLASQLGKTIKLPDRKELAILVVPTSFIPATRPCPALVDNKLCGIHEQKPARCRTMPFYPYREERFQNEVIKIKADWECDTSEAAPVIYADSKVLDSVDFNIERTQIESEVPMMQRYVEYMMKYTPTLANQLVLASTSGKAKHIVTSLSSFITATRYQGAKTLARRQIPVLQAAIDHAKDKPELAEFLRYYESWHKEMSYLSQ